MHWNQYDGNVRFLSEDTIVYMDFPRFTGIRCQYNTCNIINTAIYLDNRLGN